MLNNTIEYIKKNKKSLDDGYNLLDYKEGRCNILELFPFLKIEGVPDEALLSVEDLVLL